MIIKKFNELFDSEEVKDNTFSEDPKAEIDFLSKNFGKYAKIDYNPDENTIGKLMDKISYKCSFMSVFLDADKTENGVIDFGDFDVLVRFNEDEKYHAFIIADSRYMLVLSIRTNNNNYDLIISLYDSEFPDEIQSFNQSNITFERVISIIKNEYTSVIEDLDFDKVLGYNFNLNFQKYN